MFPNELRGEQKKITVKIMQYLPASALPEAVREAGTARNNNTTGITQEPEENTGRNSVRIRIETAGTPGRGCVL